MMTAVTTTFPSGPPSAPGALLDGLPPLDVAPGPRVAEPLPADRPVRWGILTAGRIAGSFVRNLAVLPECETVAVAARRHEAAEAFAAEHGIGTAYGDYRELVEDPRVDVVYVASPHALHLEQAMLALDAGKPVLVEKALTLTGDDAELLLRTARERELFCMEAMWMRCIPLIRRILQLVESGRIGTVLQVRADLGFRVDAPPTDRLHDPLLGGGALLDMGIYPLTFAQILLGEPETVTAAAVLSERGVDTNLAVAQTYASGAVAALTSTTTAQSPRTATIATDRGLLQLPTSFHHPTTVTWTPQPDDGSAQTLHEPLIGSGLAHEALEVVRCLRTGEIESPLVPHADTLSLMRQMDAIRRQVGVRYEADGS